MRRLLGWIFAVALLLGPSLQEAHALACAHAEAIEASRLAACSPDAPHLHDSIAPERTHDAAWCVLCHSAPLLDAGVGVRVETPRDVHATVQSGRVAPRRSDSRGTRRSRAPPLHPGR